MFPYITALLLAVVIMVLFYPLWRGKRQLLMGNEAIADEERIAQSLEKEGVVTSLSQLEIEKAQGKLTPEDYQRIKLTEEHRLLNLLDSSPSPQLQGLASPPPSAKPMEPPPQRSHTLAGSPPITQSPDLSIAQSIPVSDPIPVKRPWGIMIAMGIWIVAGTMAVSSAVYKKIARDQVAASANNPDVTPGTPPINPEEMVARLKARLDKNPNDLQGQIMLGRSYMVLERWKEAETAWQKALELDERNPMAHAALGEVLLRSHTPGDKPIAQEALVHFDQALIASPQEPSILWARGIALIALERFSEADESWTTAYQSLTPNTPDARMLKSALEALRSGKLQSR